MSETTPITETPTVSTPPSPEKNQATSRISLYVGVSVLAALLLLGSFHLGTLVGFRKASFSCEWNRSYGPMIGGPSRGFMQAPPFMKRLPDPHGAFGKVLRLDEDQMIVQDRNGIEKNILVPTSSVKIRRGMETIRFEDIKQNDNVSVFGRPGADGRVEADLIRVLQQ